MVDFRRPSHKCMSVVHTHHCGDQIFLLGKGFLFNVSSTYLQLTERYLLGPYCNQNLRFLYLQYFMSDAVIICCDYQLYEVQARSQGVFLGAEEPPLK